MNLKGDDNVSSPFLFLTESNYFDTSNFFIFFYEEIGYNSNV